MSEGLSSLGLTGLTQSVDKRADAKDNLLVLGQLVQNKKQQEAEEQAAAEKEQAYYERIRLEADKMLVGDRKKINERAIGVQAQIRENIKLFGGSRTKFFANGGLSLIGDYTNKVLDSKEVAMYKNNKVNLEKILEIKEKKMGHLLTPADLQSLKDYEQNGSGEISYTGLMNDIPMPSDKLFMFGTTTTPDQILFHEDNYVKILGNYQLENPDVDISKYDKAKLDKVLLGYTHAKGYKVRGSKDDPYAKYKQDASASAKAAAATDPNKDRVKTITGEIRRLVDNPVLVPFDAMKTGTFAENDPLRQLFGDKMFTKQGKVASTVLEGLGDHTYGTIAEGISGLFGGNYNYESNNTYVPLGANDIGDGFAMPLFSMQNSTNFPVNAEGKIEFNASTVDNVYMGNGEKYNASKHGAGKDWTVKVDGAFFGYKSMIKGQEQLMMNAVDESGKINSERNSSLYPIDKDELGNPMDNIKGAKKMFIRLIAENGEVLYQEIDYSGVAKANALEQILTTKGNDIMDQYKEDKFNDTALKDKTNEITIEREATPIVPVHNPTFDDDEYFNQQVAAYNPGGTGNLRKNLMKSYYMAKYNTLTKSGASYNINKEIYDKDFQNFYELMGMEDDLKDKRYGDMDLYQMFEKRLLSPEHSETPEILRKNTIFAKTIKNYLTDLYSK